MNDTLATINQTLASVREAIQAKQHKSAQTYLDLVDQMITKAQNQLDSEGNRLDPSKQYKVVVETTNWKVDYRQPNHTYLLDGDKIVAYRRYHEGPALFSKTGKMRLDRRHRQFKTRVYNAADWS